MTNVRAVEAINEARVALPAPIPDVVAERAAALLDDLWCAALKHDIDPDELAGLVDLADACVALTLLQARRARTR
ncbi:MAG: hypothetical protein ACRDPK_15505 [Carbonactinosporaceae bacterium]